MDVTDRLPPLRTLYLYLTEGCNCACRHCWIVPEPGRSVQGKALLEPALLRHAIEQALPLGLGSLKWTGGEPTLHPLFPELLQMQKEFGLTGVVETNGMLVSRRLAGQLREAGVEQVSVSLDSADAAVHDAIRGVPGSFQRTVAGIGHLVTAGFRPELILTLQKANSQSVPDFLALAEELGAGSVKLNVMQPVLRGGSLAVEGEALDVAEILALSARVCSEYAERHSCPVRIDLPMAFRPLSQVLSGAHDGVCNILNIIGLLPRGEYALCGIGQHVPELSLGAVRSVSLHDVWSSHPLLQRLRGGLPQQLTGVCSRCLMKAACLGGCTAANYHLSGDLLAPYWFCEQAEVRGLFPVSRCLKKTES